MDRWTDFQLAMMEVNCYFCTRSPIEFLFLTVGVESFQAGGNRNFKLFLQSRGIPDGIDLHTKYSSPALKEYRERLKAQVQVRTQIHFSSTSLYKKK